MENGFTLIELIITIFLIATLAVIAIPRLFNITSDAQTAVLKGIAGALSSANAENYVVRSENTANGLAIKNCTGVSTLLESGLPSGYKIKSGSVAVNVTKTCTLDGPTLSATFSATGIN
jgi:prepilin-type N-terminal cleavage/methylation domain-containing protein